MNEIIFFILLIYTFLIKVDCEIKEKDNYKKLLPQIRIQAEEIDNELLNESVENYDDILKDNFMSVMVNNAKEIFKSELEPTDSPEIEEMSNIEPQIITEIIRPSITSDSFVNIMKQPVKVNTKSNSMSTGSRNITYQENYISFATLGNAKYMLAELYSTSSEANKRIKLSKFHEKMFQDYSNVHVPNERAVFMPQSNMDMEPSRVLSRSCIMCNNLVSEDCNEPRNKLMDFVQCDRDDDICYSMHTPFGIIDRGCFNPNHNLTTYVCSCNLCNYLSISEMPYMFTTKKQWIENVIDISRTRRFRKSVLKDMSCLRCEANGTLQGSIVDTANCLEGNIGSVPVEKCDENEVCAIKALRAHGYIWRGCIKAPLYNYWWTLCNDDLCNGDKIMSLYDSV